MSAQRVERIERYEASLEDYLALPEDVRAEYVDGVVLVTPPASIPHNRIGVRLIRLLEDHLPETVVVYEPGLRTADRRYRVPDLLVIADEEDVAFTEQAPIIVVEILSPGTQAEDWLRKAPEYLAAGAGQYWLIDRQNRTITVLRAAEADDGREWEILLTLDDDSPTGEVQVGEVGTVPLDLAAIMPA